jgi:hypothetical protein
MAEPPLLVAMFAARGKPFVVVRGELQGYNNQPHHTTTTLKEGDDDGAPASSSSNCLVDSLRVELRLFTAHGCSKQRNLRFVEQPLLWPSSSSSSSPLSQLGGGSALHRGDAFVLVRRQAAAASATQVDTTTTTAATTSSASSSSSLPPTHLLPKEVLQKGCVASLWFCGAECDESQRIAAKTAAESHHLAALCFPSPPTITGDDTDDGTVLAAAEASSTKELFLSHALADGAKMKKKKGTISRTSSGGEEGDRDEDTSPSSSSEPSNEVLNKLFGLSWAVSDEQPLPHHPQTRPVRLFGVSAAKRKVGASFIEDLGLCGTFSRPGTLGVPGNQVQRGVFVLDGGASKIWVWLGHSSSSSSSSYPQHEEACELACEFAVSYAQRMPTLSPFYDKPMAAASATEEGKESAAARKRAGLKKVAADYDNGDDNGGGGGGGGEGKGGVSSTTTTGAASARRRAVVKVDCPDVEVELCDAGHEPPNFKACFFGWNYGDYDELISSGNANSSGGSDDGNNKEEGDVGEDMVVSLAEKFRPFLEKMWKSPPPFLERC